MGLTVTCEQIHERDVKIMTDWLGCIASTELYSRVL